MLDDPFARRLPELRAQVDARLADLLAAGAAAPSVLREAVRYALLSPGKRLRPVLAVLAAEHFGAPEYRAGRDTGARETARRGQRAALDVGCAIEMVHAASLILDDLPCMDDAELRRGRPTVHRRFGEDMAVLAAVALLNQAYAVVAAAPGLDADARLDLVRALTGAVGFEGLVAGQARDLRERDALLEATPLHELNRQKTGVLFIAAVEGGARASGALDGRLEGARAFARGLGEAFQILDDLLDATGTSESAGKDVGQDGGKPTVVSLIGADAARTEMHRRLRVALNHLDDVGPGPLSRFTEVLFGSVQEAA